MEKFKLKELKSTGRYFIGYEGPIYGIVNANFSWPRREEGLITKLIETRDFGFAAFTRSDGSKGLINLG